MKEFTPTKKQQEILALLYRFRFLNTNQIQKFLKHKHPQRIQAWLKELYEEKYIGRIYSNVFGENTKPAVYYLVAKGRKILKTKEGFDLVILERVYREKTRSERLRQHCLLLADIYLSLQKINKDKLQFFTRVDLVHYTYFPDPLPDAYIVIKNNRYFLEVIDEGTPRFAMRRLINKYIEYDQDGIWKENTQKPFPQILVVCPNDKTEDWLIRIIPRMMAEADSDISFFLSSKEDIQISGFKADAWEAAQY